MCSGRGIDILRRLERSHRCGISVSGLLQGLRRLISRGTGLYAGSRR